MNRKWIYLSYLIHPEAPAYGGNQAFFDEADKQMDKGDSCNTRLWRMSNHMGTHIDFPRHFVCSGDTLDVFPAGFWVFKKIAVVFMRNVEPGQIISARDIDFSGISSDVEFLIIKTGFCDLRDDPLYWQNNPGLHTEFASELHKDFSGIRVVGFDLISLSSFVHRELGRQAHKAFLDHSNPILLLEDMDLTGINENSMVKQVVIAPIRVKDADAAPCTVLAEVME
jgi:arylformamidase